MFKVIKDVLCSFGLHSKHVVYKLYNLKTKKLTVYGKCKNCNIKFKKKESLDEHQW